MGSVAAIIYNAPLLLIVPANKQSNGRCNILDSLLHSLFY